MFGCLLIALNFSPGLQQIHPIRVAASVLSDNTCNHFNYASQRNIIHSRILDYPTCNCGAAWTKIAHLDMEDQNQLCPEPLSLVTSTIRGCGRSNPAPSTCDSVIYPVHGRNYSHVCGRILAYQTGRASAFYNSLLHDQKSLEGAYLDGISLTYGPRGSRKHIWSFVKADHYGGQATEDSIKCPCSVTNRNWTFTVPPLVANDYFCESGNPGQGRIDGMFFNNTLWDGIGCPNSTCCEFNTPPWFCNTLPAPTTDDIELRSCYGDGITLGNVTITKVDIYVV